MSAVVGAAAPGGGAVPRDPPPRDDAAVDSARGHPAERGTAPPAGTAPPGAAPPGAAGRPLDDVVRTHLPGLLRYATVLTGDAQTAADVVQEVLLRAHVRWTRIGMMARPDLYLRRMVTNEHLSWRRRWHVRNVRPVADATLAGHVDPQRDHAQHVVEDDAMWRRLAALPPRQRTVLVLRYYEGLGDPEIADVLGTSGATVRSHASRALATLRHTDPSNTLEQ